MRHLLIARRWNMRSRGYRKAFHVVRMRDGGGGGGFCCKTKTFPLSEQSSKLPEHDNQGGGRLVRLLGWRRHRWRLGLHQKAVHRYFTHYFMAACSMYLVAVLFSDLGYAGSQVGTFLGMRGQYMTRVGHLGVCGSACSSKKLLPGQSHYENKPISGPGCPSQKCPALNYISIIVDTLYHTLTKLPFTY